MTIRHSWTSITQFYRQFGSTYAAGIDISQAIELASVRSPYAQDGHRWAEGCRNGKSLHEQLRTDGERDFICALIEAGEASSHLPRMCTEIAAFYEHAHTIRSNTIKQLAYPVLVYHVATMLPVGVASFLNYLPAWAALIGPLVFWGSLLLTYSFRRTLSGSLFLSRCALAPGIRWLCMPLMAGISCRILSGCLQAGMLFPKALRLAADSCGNLLIAESFRKSARAIEQDDEQINLTNALSAASFPRTLLNECQSGELSGQLDTVLARSAHDQLHIFQQRSQMASAVLCKGFYALVVLLVAIIAILGVSGYASLIQSLT